MLVGPLLLSIFFLSFSFILIIAQVPCTTILFHPNLVVYRADLTGDFTTCKMSICLFHFQSRAVDINLIILIIPSPPQASPSLSRFRRPIITTCHLFFCFVPLLLTHSELVGLPTKNRFFGWIGGEQLYLVGSGESFVTLFLCVCFS